MDTGNRCLMVSAHPLCLPLTSMCAPRQWNSSRPSQPGTPTREQGSGPSTLPEAAYSLRLLSSFTISILGKANANPHTLPSTCNCQDRASRRPPVFGAAATTRCEGGSLRLYASDFAPAEDCCVATSFGDSKPAMHCPRESAVQRQRTRTELISLRGLRQRSLVVRIGIARLYAGWRSTGCH